MQENRIWTVYRTFGYHGITDSYRTIGYNSRVESIGSSLMGWALGSRSKVRTIKDIKAIK